MKPFDVIVLGAGAAGLFCAGQAGQRGLRVLLIDHARRLAEKIRISGGGRANFTNRALDPHAPQRHFISQNPHFCRSALARCTPQDMLDLLQRHGVAFHEKHRGQMFCDHSAQELIRLLLAECEAATAQGGQVQRWQPCRVHTVNHMPDPSGTPLYQVDTDRGTVSAPALVVATGGLSIPVIGASDLGLRLARQFGLDTIDTRPGLVPLRFDPALWRPWSELAGLALPVRISTGQERRRIHFDEDLLFTHRGLSGPAVLQISSYWQPGQAIRLDLIPQLDQTGLTAALLQAKAGSQRLIARELANWLPVRLADAWVAQNPEWQRPIAQAGDKALGRLAELLKNWSLTPSGTDGYKKAEVTVGGVDTRGLSSQTMEAKHQPGLYFIGEVVDVTGWLGGYNFQWAWASAAACADALPLPARA